MLIITGSDDNYVPGVMVLIASAAFHNPHARFAILDMGISVGNRARIDALGHRLGVDLRRVEVASTQFDSLRVKRAHLTRSTYLRLLIPDLFPTEYSAIYMDCDMVVMGNLSPLDAVDLGTNVIAAVPCPSPEPTEVAATGHRIGTYINAGLLVMNLPVWRREGIAAASMALLSDAERPLLSEDQSAINILARGRITPLPPEFNTYSDPAAYKQVAELPTTPIVLHYVVNSKPWAVPTPMGSVWQFHAHRIADLMPPRQKVTIRRRLSLWNRERKLILGLALRSRKYLLRRQVLAIMEDRVARNYLGRATAMDQAGSLANRR